MAPRGVDREQEVPCRDGRHLNIPWQGGRQHDLQVCIYGIRDQQRPLTYHSVFRILVESRHWKFSNSPVSAVSVGCRSLDVSLRLAISKTKP